MKGFRAAYLSLGLGLFFVASVGCGSKVVKEFESIKEEMCQCKDKVCAEAVNKKFDDWMNKNVNAKGSKGQQEKAKTIAADYTKCMMNAMTGGSPTTDATKPDPAAKPEASPKPEDTK